MWGMSLVLGVCHDQQDIVDVLAPKWVDRLWNDYECSNCDVTSVTAIDHFRVNSKFGHICERYRLTAL